MKKVLIIIMIAASIAAAQEIKPEHFDYGLNAEINGKSTAYRVYLPEHVYQNVRKPGVLDLQVFNSAGEMVPFVLQEPEPYKYEQPGDKVLVFYPMHRKVTRDNATYNEISELIIDLREEAVLPNRLLIDFAGKENFNTSLKISVSTGNLDTWGRALDVNMARLSGEGTVLHNEAAVSLHADSQYLKISGSPDILALISRINAKYPEVPVYSVDYKYVDVVGMRSANQKNAVEFDLQGFYPVSGAVMRLQPSYFFPSYTLKYKNIDDDYWMSPVNVGITRNIDSQKQFIVPMKGHGRYWQIITTDELPETISAQFKWMPRELIFLDKGEGPYTIAYGSAYYDRSSRSGDRQISSMLNGRAVANSELSEPFELGDGDINPVPPAPPEPEKSKLPMYGLFALIIIVVAFLTVSAVKLMKSTNKED